MDPDVGPSESRTARFGGYWADTPYVEFHHRSQEPGRMALEVRRAGGAAPDIARPFVYCDIGCGCGFTLLNLAAAIPHGEFHGIDLDPAHIAEARRLADAAGLRNAHFHEGAAQDLPPGLIPPSDFIAAHGVFSWVNAEVVAGLLGFIRAQLKPEGLLFASVNLELGWAQMIPVRNHLREVYERARGGPRARLRHAIDEVRRDFRPGSTFAARNPTAAEVLDGWRNLPFNYVGHELLNDVWRLFTIRQVFDLFGEAGLAYAGPRLREDPRTRDEYATLIHGDDEVAIEDRLSKAAAQQFRGFVFRPAAATLPGRGMMVAATEKLGAAMPKKPADLFPAEIIDDAGPAEIALLRRAVNGEGVRLADVAAESGPDMKLKLFALINRLARTGDLVAYCAAPAEAAAPGPDLPRIAPCHPITPSLLAARYSVATAASLPSPVLGGAVQMHGSVAALLRVHLEGAKYLAPAAEALYRDAVGDVDFWAANDPDKPREIPDFAELELNYRADWLPFLQRMRVVAPV